MLYLNSGIFMNFFVALITRILYIITYRLSAYLGPLPFNLYVDDCKDRIDVPYKSNLK